MNIITKEDFKEILLIKGTEYMMTTYKIDIALLTYVEDIIDWNVVSTLGNLTESEVDLFSNRINFMLLNLKTYFNLSESWLLKNQHLVDFERLSYREDLSIDFIRNFSDRFHWNILCLSRTFSEDEIEEFISCVNWSSLTISHNLSKKFLIKYKDRIDVKYLNLQKVDKESDDFRDKWLDYNEKVKKAINDKIEEHDRAAEIVSSMTKEQRDLINNTIISHPMISRSIKLNKVSSEHSIDESHRETLVSGLVPNENSSYQLFTLNAKNIKDIKKSISKIYVKGVRVWFNISNGDVINTEPELKDNIVEFLGFSRINDGLMFKSFSQSIFANSISNILGLDVQNPVIILLGVRPDF